MDKIMANHGAISINISQDTDDHFGEISIEQENQFDIKIEQESNVSDIDIDIIDGMYGMDKVIHDGDFSGEGTSRDPLTLSEEFYEKFDNKQEKLTAGTGITIDHNIIAGKDATYDQKGIAKLATEEEIVLGVSESSVVNALQLNKAIDKEAKARLIADESIALTKLQDYLYMYESIASDMSYEEAIKYFEENFHNRENVLTATIPYGACSSIRNGNFYGRNYDWYYNTNTTFVVYDKAQKDKYEFLGVAQSVLDEIDFDSETTIQKIRLIPYLILDGVNAHSVFCNTNVVPTGDLGITTGTHSDLEGDYICQIMLPKYVLDHFTNATDAVNWIRDEAKIFAPRNATTQLELHFMVGDPNHTYIVEFVHNEAVIFEVTNSKQEVMTNFYRYGAIFDENGHVDFNSVTAYGSGLERYNILVDARDSVDSIASMRDCMNLVQYTKAYTEIYTDPVAKIINPNTWKTEWAHDYSDSTILPHPMDLHANSPLSDYEYSGIFDVLYNMYQNRSRETGTTWQTVHSSVYDIERKELYLKVQEENKQYHFVYPTTPRILQNIDEEVARAKAAEAALDGGVTEEARIRAEEDERLEGLIEAEEQARIAKDEELEESKQDKLTPGDGITINNNNVISTLWKKDTGEGSIVSVSNAANGGQAIGNFSVAEGFGTDAKGDYSHTEGQLTTANGGCAHAEGQGSTAQGNCSHAEGIDTIAQNQSEHAEGQYNKSHKTNTVFGNAGNTIHSIGIGTGAGSLEEQDRRNAVEVMQNGDVYVDGIGNYDGADYINANTVQDVISDINDSIDDLSENKQDKLIASTNIQIASDGKTISATDTTYTAGNGLTLTGTEFSANVVDNVTSTSSTNALSANMGKELQDQIDNLKARGRYLSQWNATTGQPATQPTELPYPYKTGDYYLVGTVGEVNYKPVGTSYTGAASTEIETAELGIEDTYFFDGTIWHLQQNTQKTVAFASLAGQPTDNANLASALNDKVTKNNTITGATHTKITYDSKGLVTGGTDIVTSDVTDLTSTSTEINQLHESNVVKSDLQKLHNVTATATELNVLNGITATTTELNYVDGVTSNIQTQLNSKQATISDIETIRSNASAGKSASDTIATYGDIVTHNVNEFATAAQGALADSALQSGDNVSELTNDADYITSAYHDNTKQDVISDLETIRSGATAGSTAIQPDDNISELTNDANYQNGSQVTASISEHNTSTSAHSDIRSAISTKQDQLTAGTNVDITENVISATDTKYTAGSGLTLTGTQFSANVVDNITSTSTTNALSANMGKELQDQINNLKQRGRYLSIWNCTTGLAETTPTVDPYEYKTGDYFIVGVVGTTNYRPTGSTYSESTPSTVVETGDVKVNDTYHYDGTTWTLLDIGQVASTFGSLGGSPYDNANLASALNEKVDSDDLATVATSGSYDDLSNKPTIPAEQVPADWNATTGVARILNKPTIPTVPTNVSEFTNDANYQTGTQVSSAISTHNSSNTAHSALFNAKANDNDVVHITGNESISGTKTFNDSLELKNNLSFRSYGSNNSGRLQFRAQPSDNVIRGTMAITDGYSTSGSGYSGFIAQMVARAGSTSSDPFNTVRVSNKGIEYIKEANDGTIIGKYVVVDDNGLVPSDRLSTSGSTGQVLTKTASGQSWQTIEDNLSITKNTNNKIQTVGVIDENDSSTAIKTWTGTLAEYQAIVTKDVDTIYNITDDISGGTSVYTKAQVDALLANKENVGAAYTKAEADGLLADKADIDTTYTKTATDALLAQKVTTGHEVIEFQEPTAANNYTWYRKYADGWVEQGGYSSGEPREATLPVEMADTNYGVICIQRGTTAPDAAEGSPRAGAISTTQIYVNGGVATNSVYWQVSGIAA